MAITIKIRHTEGIVGRVAIADLQKVVIPSEFLVRLEPREELGFGNIKGASGQETASNEVHSIVVLEVESGPPKPEEIGVEKPFATRENMPHEQSLDGCRAGV